MYDKLVTQINPLNTSGLALKTQHNNDKSGLEKEIDDTDTKIPDASGLLKNN